MIRSAALIVGLASVAYAIPSIAFAQDAPPIYMADPAVYKVIFEDQSFRVIQATWKPGQIDKQHAHPVPSIVYALTNCSIKLTSADGKTVVIHNKAGRASTVPITFSHHAQNIGRHTCRLLLVERR